MLTKEKLFGQYGKDNVRLASNFSEHSKNLPPSGLMVKVQRTDTIKKPMPFNPEELMSGICAVEVPANFTAKPREQWNMDAERMFGGLDGSSVHLTSDMVPDATGHQLVKKQFVIVRAGIPQMASEACHDIEKGLMSNPPKEYTWEQFYKEKKLASLRTEARQQRMRIAREFMVGSGMCSKEDADSVKNSDDITTHDIVVNKDDEKHFYVCSDVVMPSNLTRCMIFYEGPAMGFRVLSGKPDNTIFGKGFQKADMSQVIPASYGLQSIDKFGKKSKFNQPIGDGSSVYHYMDAYKPMDTKVLAELRQNGREETWPETTLRPVESFVV